MDGVNGVLRVHRKRLCCSKIREFQCNLCDDNDRQCMMRDLVNSAAKQSFEFVCHLS